MREMKSTIKSINFWYLYEAIEKIPTLAIRGELSDVLTSDTFIQMKTKKIDLKQLEVLNCGHNPTLDENEVFSSIEEFILSIELNKLKNHADFFSKS